MFFPYNSALPEALSFPPLNTDVATTSDKNATPFKMNRRKLLLAVPFIGLAVLLGGVSLIRNTETVLFGALVTALGNGLIVFAIVGYITRRKITDVCFETTPCENGNTLVTVPRSFANRPFYNYSRRSRSNHTNRRVELSPPLALDHSRIGFQRSRSQYSRHSARRTFTAGRRSQTFSATSRDILSAIEDGTVRLASSYTMRSLQDQPPSYDTVCSAEASPVLTFGGESQNHVSDNSQNFGIPSPVEYTMEDETNLSNETFDSQTRLHSSMTKHGNRHRDKSLNCIPLQCIQKRTRIDRPNYKDCKHQNSSQDDTKSRSSRDTHNSRSGSGHVCNETSNDNVQNTNQITQSRCNAATCCVSESVGDETGDLNLPSLVTEPAAAGRYHHSGLPSYESVKHIRPASE